MIIVGDIGNTETKICLINSNNKIIKKIIFDSKNINNTLVKKHLSKLKLKNKTQLESYDFSRVDSDWQ